MDIHVFLLSPSLTNSPNILLQLCLTEPPGPEVLLLLARPQHPGDPGGVRQASAVLVGIGRL